MIQELIDSASPGATVKPPAGTYDIDTLKNPIWIKKPLTLDLRGVILNVIPTDVNDRFYFPIGISGCDGVQIQGGKIIGDHKTHLVTVPDGTGLGHGVVIGDAKNVILQSMEITDCLMDGILVAGGKAIELGRVSSHGNRRQGLSASDIDGLWIHDCDFSANGGTAPSAGIDLEPDLPTQSVRNIRVERTRFTGNIGAGFLVACPPAQRSHIDVMGDCVFTGRPIDGTDGIVSWWAKLIGPYTNWCGYPRELHI